MKISEITKGDFLKYRGMQHLIRKIDRIEKKRFVIHSFFSLSTRKCGKLHENHNSLDIDEYSLETHLHPMTEEEIESFKDFIIIKHPDFDFESLEYNYSAEKEAKYIAFLKRRGFKIFKEL